MEAIMHFLTTIDLWLSTRTHPQRGVDHIGINTDWIKQPKTAAVGGCFTNAQIHHFGGAWGQVALK